METRPMRQILMGMEVGDTVCFQITLINSVKVSCTQYGLQWGKRFTTHTNRPNRTIDVTRVE